MPALADLLEGSAAVKPPLDEASLRAIPAKRGIFLLVAADGRPILLTTAADIRARLRFRLSPPEDIEGRHKTADLREITSHIYWTLTYSHFQTDWQFLELARQIWPDSYQKLLPRRSAWFVAAHTDDPAPHFAITDHPDPRWRQFGPFSSRRAAEDYIEALADVFDLCRCISVLRRAPWARPAPISRSAGAALPATARARWRSIARSLPARSLSPQAAARTKRICCRRACDKPPRSASLNWPACSKAAWSGPAQFADEKFRQIADVTDFRFIIVQSGPTFHHASSFVSAGGQIAAGPIIDFPPMPETAEKVVAACDKMAPAPASDDLGRAGWRWWRHTCCMNRSGEA